MDRLRQIEVFLAVARARSFTAAAQRLAMSRANVTKQITALESRLKVQLLLRTTRRVALTEAGLILLEKAPHLLEEFDAVEAGVQSVSMAPAGIIRVGVPPSFGAAHLVPAVAAFTTQYPGTQVALCLDRGDADLVRDGLDLSLRIASSFKDASHIARLLVRVPQVLVAAPAYLARRGIVGSLAELAQHDCLVHMLKSPTGTWMFHDGDKNVPLSVTGTIMSDFGDALRSAALLGQGISMHPMYMVADDIQAGRLVVVLPETLPVMLSIHMIYPQRNVSLRVRAFLDFLVAWLPRQAPWLTHRPTVQANAETICDCSPSPVAKAVTVSPTIK